jgi:Fe-S oxidoreductase
MLDLAKKLLLKTMKEMKQEIVSGVPIVGLEPSCVSVFKDELPNLFPGNIDAKRLTRQIYLLSEFLQTFAKDYSFKLLNKKALVHGHCHHKTVLKFQSEDALLKRLGLDYHILDSGCCGMAGSFGFEKEHLKVSLGAGERVLLPAVRNASSETLIITNGFSCKEQIEQTTGRTTHHIAEVVQMAL